MHGLVSYIKALGFDTACCGINAVSSTVCDDSLVKSEKTFEHTAFVIFFGQINRM